MFLIYLFLSPGPFHISFRCLPLSFRWGDRIATSAEPPSCLLCAFPFPLFFLWSKIVPKIRGDKALFFPPRGSLPRPSPTVPPPQRCFFFLFCDRLAHLSPSPTLPKIFPRHGPAVVSDLASFFVPFASFSVSLFFV